ncbi:MAG: nitroreductase [Pseudonocardia sp.]|nr:nitroreductase [Pseudonocardia sp.]
MTDQTPAATLAALLEGRRSCRAFRNDPVNRSEIRAVVDTAPHAPSWCNTQPWDLLVTECETTERFRKALSEHVRTGTEEMPDLPFPVSYDGAYLDRRRECGWQLYESVGVARGNREASGREMLRNFEFFGAPHLAVLTTDRNLGTYGAVDCGLFIQSFLLAARSHGIATVAQAAIASQAAFVRDFFELPPDRLVLLGISFGYADDSHPANGFRTRRRTAEEILTWASELK